MFMHLVLLGSGALHRRTTCNLMKARRAVTRHHHKVDDFTTQYCHRYCLFTGALIQLNPLKE